MSSQQDQVRLPIASPDEIERTARQLMRIREQYLSSGELPFQKPRPVILDSWQRCSALRVNMAQRCAPLAVARESQLQQVRESSALLLRAATPVLCHLTDFLATSGYVVVLSDAQGRLLEVNGDQAIRRRLAKIDFVPGGAWSEAAAGTNAIGTALATGHCVQLMAAEHYCDGWQDLTCTAAPIHHPLTGEIIGILDVTGNYHLIRPFLTGFLSAAAREIQQNIRHLLVSPYKGERQPYFQMTSARSLDTMQSVAAAMHILRVPDANLTIMNNSPTRPEVDSQNLLHHHARRVRDAEQLAAAAGIISASLDLTVTLEKVAEQAACIMELECAAVCLFEDDGAVAPYIWAQRNLTQANRQRELDTLIQHAEGMALIRERGEVVIIDDLLHSSLLPIAVVEQLGICSIALLPLATARGVIGFIAAPRYTLCRWETDDVRLGLALAALAATALENARLFATLRQHNRYVEALNTMAQFLNSLLDPAERLDLVLKQIVEIMDLDAGLVLLRHQDSGELSLVAHCGLLDAAAPNDDGTAQALHRLAIAVAGGGDPLLCCSHRDHPGAAHDQAPLKGFCDLMAMPLAVGNATLGALVVGSQNHRGLANEDLTLFTTIAQQLALALHNAQLLRSASEMEALREADRLKSQFLASVSHDLRSPLTAIRASIEGLIEGSSVQSRQEQEQLLQNIASQARRLGRLVDQLLELSRIEAGALTLDRDWTELPILLADVVAKFEELNPESVIEQVIAPHLPLQYIDPDSLVQVLWNLLENACKYAPPRSPIRLEACCIRNEVLINVADRGCGIPPTEREKIFQHFYRLKREHQLRSQGSGLGLAICRGIVEAHGGRIWVEDRPGGGSIFWVALPAPEFDPTHIESLDEHHVYS